MLRRLLYGLILLMIAGYLLTGVTQVRRGERGVVRRFGRVLEEKPTPGLWIGLPWGMDRLDRIEVDALRSVAVGQESDAIAAARDSEVIIPPGQLMTGDRNLVNAQAMIYYKVRPEEVADFALSGDRAPEVLQQAAMAVMAEWIASHDVDAVLLDGQRLLGRTLKARLPGRITGLGLGIEIADVRVVRLVPPDEVKNDFDAVASAQTRMATLRYRAEQEAASRLHTAEADADRTTKEAQADAYARRAAAGQEAALFLHRLRLYREGSAKSPDYLRVIWQEERAKVFAKIKDIDLLDHRLSGGGLDFLTMPRVPKP